VTTVFHNQVRLDGFDFQDSQFTVKLAAGIDNTMTGLAVTWDSSAANQMKLSGDGDPIHGVLMQVENRLVEGQLVGMVSLAFAELLQIKAGLSGGQIVAVGSVAVGAGNGLIRTGVVGTDLGATAYGPRVVELRDATHAVVIRP
jgi:hypothetical protein